LTDYLLQIDTIELHPQTMLPRAIVEDFGQLSELFKKGNIQVRSGIVQESKATTTSRKSLKSQRFLAYSTFQVTRPVIPCLPSMNIPKNGLYFGIHNHFFKGKSLSMKVRRFQKIFR
jgi:hypothetical protein